MDPPRSRATAFLVLAVAFGFGVTVLTARDDAGPASVGCFDAGEREVVPALQAVGIDGGYYLFNAAPYVLTLAIMVITCSPKRTLTGAPGALGASN